MKKSRILFALSVLLLVACGADPDPDAKEVIDVTPTDLQNIVTETGAKVDAAVQQSKADLDAAIEAETSPD